MVMKGQDLNILINIFFSPSVNAARGLAFQVNNLVTQFFSSFYTAVQPQITKYYAKADICNMSELVFRSAKLSFYLILIVALPIEILTENSINLWLGVIPEYVISFIRLMVLMTAIDALSNPLMTAVQATGRIKYYQIVMGTFIMMNLPISFLFLKNGFNPEIVFIVSCSISFFSTFIRLQFLKILIDFPMLKFIKNVILKVIIISIVSCILPLLVKNNINIYNMYKFVFVVFICIGSTLISIWSLGLSDEEKRYIVEFYKKTKTKVQFYRR